MDVKIDISGVKPKLNKICTNQALGKMMAETCARKMDPYIPFREGMLAAQYTTEPFRITYEVPYAHYQFTHTDLTHPQNGQHPLATSNWDKAMVRAKGKELASEIKQYIDRM